MSRPDATKRKTGILASRRNRRILWVFRFLFAGCLFFIPTTGAALVWFYFDRTE